RADPDHAGRDPEKNIRLAHRLLGRESIRLALRPDVCDHVPRDSIHGWRKVRAAEVGRVAPLLAALGLHFLLCGPWKVFDLPLHAPPFSCAFLSDGSSSPKAFRNLCIRRRWEPGASRKSAFPLRNS